MVESMAIKSLFVEAGAVSAVSPDLPAPPPF
jgi:hypothetical protein